MSKNITNSLYHNSFLERLFHTFNYCLKAELKNCSSVLDLGCGPSSPVRYCHSVSYSVGVETHAPYIKESRRQKIHTKYLNRDAAQLQFPKGSFDAVLLLELLEHLPKKESLLLLEKAEKWAKKKVIISTPNGYSPMEEFDSNIRQKHLSGWSVNELTRLGFRCQGLSGLKYFYHSSNRVLDLYHNKKNKIFQNIKYKPKIFFYVLNSLFQIFVYHLPQAGSRIFAVKTVNF